MREVLRVARNATLHYPKPGEPELARVLQGFADDEVTGEFIVGQTMPTLRAAFADEVILRLALREVSSFDEQGIGGLFKPTADTELAIIHVALVAMDVWITEQGGDTSSTSKAGALAAHTVAFLTVLRPDFGEGRLGRSGGQADVVGFLLPARASRSSRISGKRRPIEM
jgi:hypothetical protein